MFKNDEIANTISSMTSDGQFNAVRLKAELEVSADKREDLRTIIEVVLMNAAGARLDAGYGGRWDDGGASNMVASLEGFLDGIIFCKTGRSTRYGHIVEKARLEDDPEYQQYLALKKRFEDN